MRTRIYNWYDTVSGEVLYGIQGYYNNKWMNIAEDGKPLLYENSKDRDIKRSEISKIKIL